jgi:hypothetical protein
MNKLTTVLVSIIVVLSLTLAFISMKVILTDEKSVSASVPVEQVQNDSKPDSLDKYETVSVDANVKLLYHETIVIDEYFFDEDEKQWYIKGDDWALEGSSFTAVKDMEGAIVEVEYYIVEGQEILNSWKEVGY